MKAIKERLRKINWLRNILTNTRYLIRNNLHDMELEIMDLTLENAFYELEDSKKYLHTFNILDEEESIKLLMQYPKSLCRMGDGEIGLMKGEDQDFQKYDKRLAEKLLDILQNQHNDMYVAINRAYFSSALPYCERNKRFYRRFGRELRSHFLEVCNPNTIYLDAGFLCAYYRYNDKYDYDRHFENMLRLFEEKKIALACGERILDKIQFDVFERAIDKIIIPCPTTNAFSKYDEIIETINDKVPKDYLVCIVLGMTAKALVLDLTKMGYMAWDVGHLIKDYDEYKKGLDKSEENKNAFWGVD